MEYVTAGANSFYNSLQVGLNKRLSRGLQFQSSYTWSHSIDDTQGVAGAEDGYQRVEGDSVFNRLLDRGASTFDVRHNWSFNTIYRLPLSLEGGMGKMFNGWWTSAIVSWTSGYPFVPNVGRQRSRAGLLQDSTMHRPDVLPGVEPDTLTRGTSRGCGGAFTTGRPLNTPDLFYDPCAFVNQPLGFIGNAGRGIMYGPNFSDVSLSLGKDTSLGFLGEQGVLQFRAEFFNLFNHPSFEAPRRGSTAGGRVFSGTANVQAPVATAGRIPGTVSKSRQIQLALKLIF